MEIVIVWSWFSFILGLITGPILFLVIAIGAAYRQWKKRQKDTLSVDKLFQQWGGRDNSSL